MTTHPWRSTSPQSAHSLCSRIELTMDAHCFSTDSCAPLVRPDTRDHDRVLGSWRPRDASQLGSVTLDSAMAACPSARVKARPRSQRSRAQARSSWAGIGTSLLRQSALAGRGSTAGAAVAAGARGPGGGASPAGVSTSMIGDLRGARREHAVAQETARERGGDVRSRLQAVPRDGARARLLSRRLSARPGAGRGGGRVDVDGRGTGPRRSVGRRGPLHGRANSASEGVGAGEWIGRMS